MDTLRYTLTSLLSSTPFKLAYALPLLLLSVLVTFAGTFLTLDRSRSFPPHYDSLPGSTYVKRSWYILEGGIGGLAVGYIFGLHLSTFIALLIPSLSTTSAPLSPSSFLVTWILSSASCSLLGGRYRLAAVFFSGILGGASLPLAISVLLHPALSTRVILVATFTPLIFLLAALPIQRTQRHSLRLANASAGAFGTVIAIAALANAPAWANVWERLWMSDNIEWGGSKERGLSAAFCLFLVFGMASDWVLRRIFGECPDEKWDSYLASYAHNMPNQADRAGTFRPAPTLWERLFGSKSTDGEMHFPKTNLPHHPPTHDYQNIDLDLDLKMPPPTGFLKKHKTKRRGLRKPSGGNNAGRKPIKFKPLDDSSGSESDNEHPKKPHATVSSSAPTLVDESNPITPVVEKDALLQPPNAHKYADGQPEYSDYEEDLTVQHRKHGEGKWTPDFLKRQRAKSQHKTRAQPPPSTVGQFSSHASSTIGSIVAPPLVPPGAMPVPATPSLLNAINRIAAAQKDVFGALPPEHPARGGTYDGLPNIYDKPPTDAEAAHVITDVEGPGRVRSIEGMHKGDWDEFWRDVKDKARQ